MRPIRALALGAACWLAGATALAQTVSSPQPDGVSVTIYRAPGAGPGELDLEWLQGYALITEKRTITIPRGRATIRFEGVAGGILPESAIVTGLPEGVREKNLDADLLNPRSLYDRSYGRPVTIRRVREGKQVEERAIIRSGSDGAAILETKDGYEAVNCGPTDDTLVYDGVPAGLSPKPTLSIETDSPEARTVTITLSYLAWGFDWQANYVARLGADGKSLDLFAWVTLANSDVTSFPDAETMVVAGRINREDSRPYEGDSDAGELTFSCFPVRIAEAVPPSPPAPPPPPAPMAMAPQADAGGAEIIVTGARMATQEELGDLKLYRIPDRTTVSASAMKQVAMIDRRNVPVDVIYRARIWNDDLSADPRILLRMQNRKDKGLGLPLPQGMVAIFAPRGSESILIGEGRIFDKAINEEVEIEIGDAAQVNVELEEVDSGDDWEDDLVTVTNANPFPVRFEAELTVNDGYTRARTSSRLVRKNGKDIWAVEVPANGTATLRYRLVRPKDR